jgi:hypothetical protein
VNSKPLAISIGDFNKLETGLGGIAYVQKFLIQVADSSGLAVPDAVVSMSVDITHFGKGAFGGDYYITGRTPPTRQSLYYPNPSVNDSLTATTATLIVGASPTGTQTIVVTYSNIDVPQKTYDPVTGVQVTNSVVWCVNEVTVSKIREKILIVMVWSRVNPRLFCRM